MMGGDLRVRAWAGEGRHQGSRRDLGALQPPHDHSLVPARLLPRG